jgi:hypothetical protein
MGGGRFEGAKLSEPAETERSRPTSPIPTPYPPRLGRCLIPLAVLPRFFNLTVCNPLQSSPSTPFSSKHSAE